MQMLFFMTPDEESQFVAYVASKSGYFMPQYWPTYPMPVLEQELQAPRGRADPLRELMIFNEAQHTREAARSEEWKQYWAPGNKFTAVTRPGLEFTRPCVEGGQLLPGKLGLEASADSFTPPDRRVTYQEHPAEYRDLERFYKACCSFLRKSLSKHATGWYMGRGVEQYCTTQGLSRAASTHL